VWLGDSSGTVGWCSVPETNDWESMAPTGDGVPKKLDRGCCNVYVWLP